MRTKIVIAIRNVGVFILFAPFTALSCAVALAQGEQQDTIQAKLAKTVHLEIGVTTVEKLMATLSNQTGLTIKAAEYLRERSLTTRMDNVSARTALEALDALNDWTWSVTPPNQILVSRRRLRLDAGPAAIPRAMQSAIPADMRTYMHIATPTEDMTKYDNIFDSTLPMTMRAGYNTLMKSVISDQTDLLTSLAPAILTGDPIPFGKMTQLQRSQLCIALVFPVLRETDYQLLHGDILPHVADVNNAVLQMHGPTTLLIGSEINDGKSTSEIGFGAQIR